MRCSAIPLDTDLDKMGDPKEVPPRRKLVVCRQGQWRETGGRPEMPLGWRTAERSGFPPGGNSKAYCGPGAVKILSCSPGNRESPPPGFPYGPSNFSLLPRAYGNPCRHTRYRVKALEPIRQGVRDCLGDSAPRSAQGLALRHDHGNQYRSHDFQEELAFLGIESSPALVRAPEGNGVGARFVRILKENLLWVRTSCTVEELRQALLEFKRIKNENRFSQRQGNQTPAQLRRLQLQALPLAA